VSGPWASSFTTLSPTAATLLRAMTVLETAMVVPTRLAAALGVTESDIETAVHELRRTGWVDGADTLVNAARVWLTFDATDRLSTVDAQVAARFIGHHLDRLDPARHGRAHAGRWAREHRDEIVAAIRAGARTGMRRAATSLASAAWRIASEVTDPLWWHALARHGEAAAAGDPRALLNLLTLSAAVYAEAGDPKLLPKAETQCERAYGIAVALDDHDMATRALTALVTVFHDGDQPERAAETLLELANTHQTAGDDVARASALAALGTVMLDAGRAEFAETYLERADELLARADSPPPGLRARVAELRGRALWAVGKTIRARRSFRQAHAMLDESDTTARERLHILATTPIDTLELPPDTSGGSWRTLLGG
jgi:predicted negative regulator of RcsB-dependent stress response